MHLHSIKEDCLNPYDLEIFFVFKNKYKDNLIALSFKLFFF